MNTIAYQFFSTVEIIQLSGAAIATAKNSHESLSASSAGKWTLLAPVGWANDPSFSI